MDLYRYTHLGRTFDLRTRTHLAIALIGIGSGAFALAIGNDLLGGVRAGIAAGLAWALARELHPDNNPSALLAGVIGGVFQATVGGVALGVCYLMIVSLRVIVRTLGAAPKASDLALHLPVVLFVSDTIPGFLAALGLSIAMFLSPSLPRPAPRSHRAWGVAFTAVALAGLAINTASEAGQATAGGWVLFAVAMVASIRLFPTTRPESLGDIDRKPLDGSRLKLGRIELVALLAVIAVTTAGAGVMSTAPALAAVIGTGLFASKRTSHSDVGPDPLNDVLV